jgi:predicted GH43/DUF377 family glycosyl hydrolase
MRKFFIWMFTVIAIFTQAYGQTSWVIDPNNPVFPRGASGEWDDELVAGPFVLFDGTVYHMWYAGYDGTSTRIGYAYSSNGINNWTRYPNPVLDSGPSGSWDELTVFQPCVLFDGTTYHMWFGGHNGKVRRIGYATSPDGITWTKYDDPTTTAPPYAESDPVLDIGLPGSWENDWVDSPNVLFIDGVFHMWYSGNDDTNNDRYTRSGHATSTDGIVWVKDSLNPVLNVGSAGSWDDIMCYQPSVLFDGNKFHMWYSGGGVFNWSIGYAYSLDGRNWIKDTLNNPVLEPRLSGEWDDTYVGLCSAIFNADSTGFKLWYTGGTGFVIGDIGYASTTGPTSVEDNKPGELPQDFSLLQNYPNPFNPSTTIEFNVLKNSEVTLKIFNMLGEEVATLVSDRLTASSYSYEWDASNLASGVYLYRLEAGSFVETRKMVLMK